MTSDIESMKTNEFLRRRKLRLQQVRDQSKDIAKKIRQRTNIEKLRQTADLDTNKKKDYFDRQQKLVKKLEILYANGVKNIGASHKSATDVKQQDSTTKQDLAKLRGREAAAELKRKKQERLDEQKKLLDRKLQAREAANELSREKSSIVANKLLGKTSKENINGNILADNGAIEIDQKPQPIAKKNDMGTQCDNEEQLNEWEPAIPTLSLPKDDRDSVKESEINLIDTKSEKSRRFDLFAVSREMPSSLRGGNVNIPDERIPIKPSLTLVSEYLQSRGLRLREPESSVSIKKPSEDLNSLKQTIQRTRVSRPQGRSFDVCSVLDDQVIPVPKWHAEASQPCQNKMTKRRHTVDCKEFKCNTNSQINEIYSSIRPTRPELMPSPVLRGSSPFRRNKVAPGFFSAKGSNAEKSKRHSQDIELQRKSSVTMYNHSTRNVQDIPCHDERLVVRDLQNEEDAFSQAARESSINNDRDLEHQKKIENMRNKVAMTKQSVEKEYKDTINFLNSLPKEKTSKAVKTSFMDDRRQRTQKENRQRILQQEYKKIEKECKRHHCNKTRSQSKSPVTVNQSHDFENMDFQYSWMPVPESDGNLAIHTIPTTTRGGKTGNSVKFSKVDSYHEYRSRHKHTPPTKDTTHQKSPIKKVVQTIESSSETFDSTASSDTSSVKDLRLEKSSNKSEHNLSDAERIIIYKIIDSRSDVKSKKKHRLVNDVAKSLSSVKKHHGPGKEASHSQPAKQSKTSKIGNVSNDGENKVAFEHLQEGIYKTVRENEDNLNSMCLDNVQESKTIDNTKTEECCQCRKPIKKQTTDKGTLFQWDCADEQKQTRPLGATCTKCTSTFNLGHADAQPTPTEPTISTSSMNDDTKSKSKISTPEEGFVKLLNENGEEAGKFYIGASGFLRDDAYEMVIQLRKKGTNDEKVRQDEASTDTLKDNDVNRKASADVIKTVDTNESPDLDGEVIVIQSSENVLENLQVDANKDLPKVEQQTTKINEGSNNVDVVQPVLEKNNLVDKGVSTSFHMSYALPADAPKIDPVPKIAASTCTQTTQSSPIQRPLFIHMSSSTSTAYMSPPEMVLPKYLKKGYTNEDQYYEPVSRIDLAKQQINTKHKVCNCKRCSRKRSCSANTNSKTRNNSEDDHVFISTPPNSPSCASGNKKRCKYHRTDSFEDNPLIKNNRTKCRCSKKVAHDNHRTDINSDPYRYNNRLSNKRLSRNVPSDIKDNLSKFKKKNKDPNSNNTELNPLVKNYVNKLLNLNKEGLKMIQVADQDCSSVTTPGSSIINVPHNIDGRKSPLTKSISLEEIKNILRDRIISEYTQKTQSKPVTSSLNCSKSTLTRKPRLIPVHKVKSLNISRHLLKNKNSKETPYKSRPHITTTTTTTDDNVTMLKAKSSKKTKYRRNSSTLKHVVTSESISRFTDSELIKSNINKVSEGNTCMPPTDSKRRSVVQTTPRANRASMTSVPIEPLEKTKSCQPKFPVSMSTQTGESVDSDISFMKVAENKLQNMEKIADLTEQCTKRLSNLAKVLEEVRKSKSLAYSQISTSDTASDAGDKSDKVAANPIQSDESCNPSKEVETKDSGENLISAEPAVEVPLDYMPFLKNIPKPKPSNVDAGKTGFYSHNAEIIQVATPDSVTGSTGARMNTEPAIKCRAKPPPALTRAHLKNLQENVVPHELSTVVEVDSPMSIKHRSRQEINNGGSDNSKSKILNHINSFENNNIQSNVNPDLLESNVDLGKHHTKSSSTASIDDPKLQMLDLKQFNKIMLQPFISIHEYAKQYNIEHLDEGSNIDEVQKEIVNDDMSSLHSDGSLPDVIAELLKRNIITEPFKFDTASNINSTTVSTESTISVTFANARQNKRKSAYKNKENIAESSDSLSISSNPDLENAFKKLGMGWASSTLKKTKERLALSSSSNTSSSSVSQFKIKSLNHDIPALVSDSVSSVVNLSRKGSANRISNNKENLKNVEQQTSRLNAMTVKEFLTNELSKKITFNKSKNDTEEFVSLFETRMPEEMKHLTSVREDYTLSPSGNRARTSTPVQLFKSITYHSSSSSNLSNGLFSNADDISSVKMTSNSMKNHSTSDKDDLTVPNISLKTKKTSDCSKSD